MIAQKHKQQHPLIIYLTINRNMRLAVISSLLFSLICSLYTGYVGIRESFGFSWVLHISILNNEISEKNGMTAWCEKEHACMNKQFAVLSWLTSLFFIRMNTKCRLDNQYHSIDDLYIKPYTRAAQYITGIWTGYYLSKINRQFGVRKVSVKEKKTHHMAIV